MVTEDKNHQSFYYELRRFKPPDGTSFLFFSLRRFLRLISIFVSRHQGSERHLSYAIDFSRNIRLYFKSNKFRHYLTVALHDLTNGDIHKLVRPVLKLSLKDLSRISRLNADRMNWKKKK